MRERPPFSPREHAPNISVDALFTPTSWIWPTHTVKIIRWVKRGQGRRCTREGLLPLSPSSFPLSSSSNFLLYFHSLFSNIFFLCESVFLSVSLSLSLSYTLSLSPQFFLSTPFGISFLLSPTNSYVGKRWEEKKNEEK